MDPEFRDRGQNLLHLSCPQRQADQGACPIRGFPGERHLSNFDDHRPHNSGRLGEASLRFEFMSEGSSTRFYLIQTGWKAGDEWEKAYEYPAKGNPQLGASRPGKTRTFTIKLVSSRQLPCQTGLFISVPRFEPIRFGSCHRSKAMVVFKQRILGYLFSSCAGRQSLLCHVELSAFQHTRRPDRRSHRFDQLPTAYLRLSLHRKRLALFSWAGWEGGRYRSND
jgi:hypothetical protein